MNTTTTGTVTMSTERLDQIAELLEITEQFLRTHLQTVHRDLDELLLHRGITGGPGWLIDVLGATGFGLRAAASTPAASSDRGGSVE